MHRELIQELCELVWGQKTITRRVPKPAQLKPTRTCNHIHEVFKGPNIRMGRSRFRAPVSVMRVMAVGMAISVVILLVVDHEIATLIVEPLTLAPTDEIKHVLFESPRQRGLCWARSRGQDRWLSRRGRRFSRWQLMVTNFGNCLHGGFFGTGVRRHF